MSTNQSTTENTSFNKYSIPSEEEINIQTEEKENKEELITYDKSSLPTEEQVTERVEKILKDQELFNQPSYSQEGKISIPVNDLNLNNTTPEDIPNTDDNSQEKTTSPVLENKTKNTQEPKNIDTANENPKEEPLLVTNNPFEEIETTSNTPNINQESDVIEKPTSKEEVAPSNISRIKIQVTQSKKSTKNSKEETSTKTDSPTPENEKTEDVDNLISSEEKTKKRLYLNLGYEKKKDNIRFFIGLKRKEIEEKKENLNPEEKTLFKKITAIAKNKKTQLIIGAALLGISIAIPPVGGAAWLTGGLVSGFLPAEIGVATKVLGGAAGGFLMKKFIEKRKAAQEEKDKKTQTTPTEKPKQTKEQGTQNNDKSTPEKEVDIKETTKNQNLNQADRQTEEHHPTSAEILENNNAVRENPENNTKNQNPEQPNKETEERLSTSTENTESSSENKEKEKQIEDAILWFSRKLIFEDKKNSPEFMQNFETFSLCIKDKKAEEALIIYEKEKSKEENSETDTESQNLKQSQSQEHQSNSKENKEREREKEKLINEILQKGGFRAMTSRPPEKNGNQYGGFYELKDDKNQKKGFITTIVLSKNEEKGSSKIMANRVHEIVSLFNYETLPVYKNITVPAKKNWFGKVIEPEKTVQESTGETRPALHSELVKGGDEEPCVRLEYLAVGTEKNPWQDYIKGGRNGQQLEVQVLIPESQAEKLKDLLVSDPTAIREIIANFMEQNLEDPSTWSHPKNPNHNPLRPPYEEWDQDSNGGNIYIQTNDNIGWNDNFVKKIPSRPKQENSQEQKNSQKISEENQVEAPIQSPEITKKIAEEKPKEAAKEMTQEASEENITKEPIQVETKKETSEKELSEKELEMKEDIKNFLEVLSISKNIKKQIEVIKKRFPENENKSDIEILSERPHWMYNSIHEGSSYEELYKGIKNPNKEDFITNFTQSLDNELVENICNNSKMRHVTAEEHKKAGNNDQENGFVWFKGNSPQYEDSKEVRFYINTSPEGVTTTAEYLATLSDFLDTQQIRLNFKFRKDFNEYDRSDTCVAYIYIPKGSSEASIENANKWTEVIKQYIGKTPKEAIREKKSFFTKKISKGVSSVEDSRKEESKNEESYTSQITTTIAKSCEAIKDEYQELTPEAIEKISTISLKKLKESGYLDY